MFGGDGERESAIPELSDQVVSRIGDLWTLGDSRLYCGDATLPASFTTLLKGEKVRAVITGPPYNVEVAGHITSGGKHDEFVMASGEMTDDEFTGFLTAVKQRSAENLADGGLIYLFMDWRHQLHVLTAAQQASLELLNLLIWDKTAGGMGSFYRSRHELIFLFRKPGASHLNRVELGKHGRNRSNGWTFSFTMCGFAQSVVP